MRGVVAGVAAGGSEVDRHSSVVTDGKNEQQLLQVGSVVLFCPSWTLSFIYVLEFSTDRKEELDVQEEVFIA
jgi:hypothetical protein